MVGDRHHRRSEGILVEIVEADNAVELLAVVESCSPGGLRCGCGSVCRERIRRVVSRRAHGQRSVRSAVIDLRVRLSLRSQVATGGATVPRS